jgi:hypothetical protein
MPRRLRKEEDRKSKGSSVIEEIRDEIDSTRKRADFYLVFQDEKT